MLALLAGACGSGERQALEFDVSNILIEAGTTSNGTVDISGTTVTYAVTVPDGFSKGDSAPVLLAFPPGDQTIEGTRNTVDQVYAREALRLGWVVVSPAAPGGDLFFQGGEDVLPGFVDWIEAWVTPEGGAPHVAGMSNGGLSSFRFAAENPDRVLSVIAFPGFARSDSDRDALAELSDVPIQIYIGGNDAPWIDGATATVDAARAAGVSIHVQTFPGEDHIIMSTYDGRIVFEQLERFRR